MTGLKRNIQPLVEQLLTQFPVVAILGTRQCGKTTLTQHMRPHWLYMDLENARDYDRLSYDPLLFFEQNPQAVIIDEAQILPPLFQTLRGIIDQKREQKGRFILTGSSSPALIEQLSETLAGRIAYIELSPLKANERYAQPLSHLYHLLTSKAHPHDYMQLPSTLSLTQMRQHWLWGGYPEIVINDSATYWMHWMQQYRETYLNRDMSQLFPKMSKINYRHFLGLLARLSGTIINKANLARNLEVSQPTIRQYMDIAQGTFIWRNLPSYSNNKLKSTVKMPKGFIRDSGLLHHALKIQHEETLFSDPNVGLSFEGFVIEEILGALQAAGAVNIDSYFYRTKNGAEIDLILDTPSGLIPIEVKYGSFTPLRQLTSLQRFIDDNQLPLGFVINQSNEITLLTKNILQIPVNFL